MTESRSHATRWLTDAKGRRWRHEREPLPVELAELVAAGWTSDALGYWSLSGGGGHTVSAALLAIARSRSH